MNATNHDPASPGAGPPLHEPVLLPAVLDALAPGEGKVLFDGTVGTGGHAEAWLERGAPDARLVGVDRDPRAVEQAAHRLARFGDRALLVHGDYRDAGAILDEAGAGTVDAVLLDLGLGTHQLDDPERGFAVRWDGPLDMRFDPGGGTPTAAQWLASASERELARVFREYGELRAAPKLARAVVQRRRARPLTTTAELAELVREVVPRRVRGRLDPAIPVFQALRIAVNDELLGLGEAIVRLVDRLRPGGRIAVIAFHSLEDRIVKRTLRELATTRHQQPDDPPGTGREAVLELVERRAVRASEDELARVPRARSARLRWGVRR